MNDLLQRLRERKLVQWALAYAAAAFALLQGLDIVAQQFGWPEALRRGITIALIIGFFVTLVLAWYHGERGAQKVSATELAILTLLLAIGGAVLWRVAPGSRAHESRAPEPEIAANAKSIAVLPFENLSDDKANAYFAEGIQDEILTRLAKIGALKVISRTSTQQYSAKPGNLQEIARQLGVANILEGTVQKSGESVHINVQLIRAASDEHLWAESYNRTLDDIFGVEGEVAQAVADVLKAKLSGAEATQLASKPTRNPAAYDAYLRGLSLLDRTAGAGENSARAIAAFEQAVSLDPELAPAWARLSYAQSRFYFSWEPSNAHQEAARHASEVAARLAPAAAETLLAQGFYRYWVEANYAGARAIFERLRSELPSGSEPIYALAGIARAQGRWRESQQLFAEAMALDPRNLRLVSAACYTALATRDFATAQGMVERALAIAPADAGARVLEAELLQMRGEVEQAQRVIEQATIPAGDVIFLYVATSNAILLRRYGPALAAIETELARPDRRPSDDGYLQFLRGELQRHAGASAAARGSYQQARSILSSQLPAAPRNYWLPATLAQVEAGLGNEAEALEKGRKAVALLPATVDAYWGPYLEEVLARVQARFGHKDQAIAALQRLSAISYGSWPVTAAALRLDPDWDTLRDDPRFQKLLQEPPAAKADR
jgi:TolB-like protein/Tfp pilus assembly protein PilF